MRIRVSSLRSLFVLAGLALLAAPASAVSITWTFVGDPGNAADTASNCFAASCGSVSYEYYISTYEVTNAQYAEFLNAKAAADPLGLYNTSMGSDAHGGITRSGSSGSYTYAVKPGFADKPVNFVSFYDTLRFTNWLNNGQGSADTETGAYTLLGGTATPSNGLTVHAQRRARTSSCRARTSGTRRRTTTGSRRRTSTTRRARTRRRSARRRRRTANRANCEQRRRRRDGRGRLHGLGEPVRDVRPGWERVRVERADRERLVPGHPGRELGQQRRQPRRVGPEQHRPDRPRSTPSGFASRVSSPSPARACS